LLPKKTALKQRAELWWSQLRSAKHGRLIPALFALTFAFLLISLATVSKTPESTEKASRSSPAAFDADDYAQKLEASLKELVEHIEGAGKTTVFVSVDSSVEYVYATQTTEESSQTSLRKTLSYVFSGGYSASDPILIKQLQPTVRGVVVVCRGGAKPEVKLKVTEAIKTALNISSGRVYVTDSQH